MDASIVNVPCPVCDCAYVENIYQDNGIDGPGYKREVVGQFCPNCGVVLRRERNFVVRHD